MSVKLESIRVNLDKKNNFLSKDLIKLLKKEGSIYLLPFKLFLYIQETIEDDNTLSNLKYWKDILNLYSTMVNGIYSSTILKDRCNGNSYITHIEKWFEKGILRSRGYYTVGKESFKYNFTETYDYCFLIINEEKEMELKIEVELDEYYKNTLLNANIFTDKAIYNEYILSEDINNFVHRVNNIFSFLNRRYINKGTKVDRWYNSFSSLTSISRKYVHIDNKLFFELDLSNAQPTFLSNILIDKYDIDERYINDTKNGHFYNSIMDYAKENNIISDKTYDKIKGYRTNKFFMNRDDVKVLCYQNIFFNQNENTNIFKIFKTLYPKTYEALIKEIELFRNGETLSQRLQNLEAYIFLNIKPKCNYFTVHDAIYFTDIKQQNYIRKRVEELIGNKNFTLSPGIKDLEKQLENRMMDDITIISNNNINILMVEDRQIKKHKKHKKHKNSNELLILDLKNKGYRIFEIMKELNISRKTVNKYYNIK